MPDYSAHNAHVGGPSWRDQSSYCSQGWCFIQQTFTHAMHAPCMRIWACRPIVSHVITLHVVQITLPGSGQSFAFIYSIEDPKGNSPRRGVGAQVRGKAEGATLV